MIIIDNVTYNIDVVSVKRTADFLDSEATTRLQNGDMYRDLIGVYFNYQLRFAPETDRAEYTRLWNKLTEPVEFHTVTVPNENGDYTFTAYFAGVGDELYSKAGFNRFKNLTVNFKAKSPRRR